MKGWTPAEWYSTLLENCLPWHGLVWHSSCSSPSPTQGGTALPLLVSASVEHSRFLLRDPVPHVAEQGDQEPHGFQLEQGPEQF